MGSQPTRTSSSTDPVTTEGVTSRTEIRDDTPEASVTEMPLTLTDVLTVISNRRRRFALHHLQRNGPSATLGELARQIAAWELEKPIELVTAAERKNVYNALAQTHVRQLREHGFITEHRGGIKLTTDARSIRIQSDIVPENQIHWSKYYLSVGAFALATSAALVHFAPVAAPVGGWGILVAGLVLVSAVAHWHYNRRMCLGVGELPPELRHDK
ncbi:MAG: hypothetical protein A07HR60_02897 [uncultured archaeon A07HR60]|jgi:hypothetical protein|nr:MAG: hypothetical protein A07HR60_02897 [uncultured archaeon A07HR60]